MQELAFCSNCYANIPLNSEIWPHCRTSLSYCKWIFSKSTCNGRAVHRCKKWLGRRRASPAFGALADAIARPAG
jgi:hypothetical protein